MVKTAHPVAIDKSGQLDVVKWQTWLSKHYRTDACNKIAKALALADQYGSDVPAEHAESAYQQGLVMAEVLSELKADTQALIAAMIYPLFAHDLLKQELVTEQLGSGVWRLLVSTQQMLSLHQLHSERAVCLDANKIDGLRKMILAMISDVRVVLIKLAESTCAMRASDSLAKSTSQAMAQEIMQVYAPLANRLGIGQLKWELEDRAFRLLHPDTYRQISHSLDAKRIERERHINKVIAQVNQCLTQQSIEADIQGRVKHVYSIWRKMQKKNLDFDQLFDLRAIRILVKDISSCYQVLGIINDNWHPVPGQFDDYIAHPKPNGYKSIHTVVEDDSQRTVEVQIRTFTMHEENEMGVAAHWRYKEGGGRDVSLEQRINWLRSLMDWQEELAGQNVELEQLRQQAVATRIYVFTPEGAVIDLPEGATPLDFAYHVHTEVGHRCKGAKVNGRMVPLTYQLQTGDQVTILTHNTSRPSRDWMNVDAGYLKSSKARAKVQSWFRHQDKTRYQELGKEKLHKTMRRIKAPATDDQAIAHACGYEQAEDLYYALGLGVLKTASLSRTVLTHFTDEQAESAAAPVKSNHDLKEAKSRSDGTFVIGGVDDLMAHMAGCCRPVFGDQVTGFITQGRGVTVHRSECQQLQNMLQQTPNRIIDVNWGEHSANKVFTAFLRILAQSQANTLRDITQRLASEKVAICGLQAHSDKRLGSDNIQLFVDVKDNEQLVKVQNIIKQIPGVIKVDRA